jgi:PAS domain S-box-containing protein
MPRRRETDVESELDELRRRLAEAEETLRALRSGEVDALVVDGESGPQVFTLKDAAEPYRLLVEQMREGALTLSQEGGILYCNEAFAAIAGEAAPHVIGSSILDFISKPDFDRLAGPEGCRGSEMTLRRAGGGEAAVTASSVPLLVEGDPVISAVITDLTGHQLRLRYEAIVESVGVPIYSLTPDLVIESWNPGAQDIFGYTAQEIIGRPVRDICPKGDYEALEKLAEDVRQCGRALSQDAQRLRKDGSVFQVIYCLAPLFAPDGKLTGYAAISHDITERKAQERTKQLLLDELNHRVKNTLAIVQSIARLTLRQAKSSEHFAESFTGRIQALSGAHDVLTASSWQGAQLRSLVKDQLIFGDANDGRITCDGPAITLDAQTAVGLSLVLHELGANASKYGALSVANGRVTLSWQAPDGEIHLRWQEAGGPLVSEPSHRGFGTFIIEQSLRGLDGDSELRFEPAGLVCNIRLPVRKARKQ